MRLFRKLFAEKILRFYEGTNAGIRYISNAPLIGLSLIHISEPTRPY